MGDFLGRAKKRKRILTWKGATLKRKKITTFRINLLLQKEKLENELTNLGKLSGRRAMGDETRGKMDRKLKTADEEKTKSQCDET